MGALLNVGINGTRLRSLERELSIAAIDVEMENEPHGETRISTSHDFTTASVHDETIKVPRQGKRSWREGLPLCTLYSQDHEPCIA